MGRSGEAVVASAEDSVVGSQVAAASVADSLVAAAGSPEVAALADSAVDALAAPSLAVATPAEAVVFLAASS